MRGKVWVDVRVIALDRLSGTGSFNMADKQRPERHSGKNADHKTGEKGAFGVDDDFHLGEFLAEHWLAVTLLPFILLLMTPLTSFPGGNPKQLWWVCLGFCLLASLLIYLLFARIISRLEPPPPPANLLIPASEPDPPFAKMVREMMIKKLKERRDNSRNTAGAMTDEYIDQVTAEAAERAEAALSEPGVVKIFYGSNVATMGPSGRMVVVQISGKDLLAFRRVDAGLEVDANIFGEDGDILAQVVGNKFFINQNNTFRIQNDDPHSLSVFDFKGNEVFNIRYINPSSIVVTGTFRYGNSPPLVITREKATFGSLVVSGSLAMHPSVIMTLGSPPATAPTTR